jgi:hypothetical protein
MGHRGYLKNPEIHADFKTEEIFQKKDSGKKLEPKNIFGLGIF